MIKKILKVQIHPKEKYGKINELQIIIYIFGFKAIDETVTVNKNNTIIL